MVEKVLRREQCVWLCNEFPPTSRFKWIDHKEFDWDKYTRNSSKGYVLKVELGYPRELHK